MSLSEAATIWMSSMAMKKPTHMTAKANVFLPGERSAAPVGSPAPATYALAVCAPPAPGARADAAAPDPDTRVSVAMSSSNLQRQLQSRQRRTLHAQVPAHPPSPPQITPDATAQAPTHRHPTK